MFCGFNEAALQANFYSEEKSTELISIDRSELNNILHGRFDPVMHRAFVKIDSIYCDREMYMLEEAYLAFVSMAQAALQDSVKLQIVSATRDFDQQKMLWENKWTGKTPVDGKRLNLVMKDVIRRAVKILEYTAPPGYTRHHWGTDIDLNSVEPSYFDTEEGMRIYQWLCANASRFGFCQTYPAIDEKRPVGFNEEKWHWSYVVISNALWEAQLEQFSSRNICGFKGCNAVKKVRLINYLTGISRCGE
ncbi:MAG: M15 family metallopeptidase [Saprospiraceae bacterium]|nr:M15 family metallopeptidase [Saprospiraceae bacterium]